MSNKISNELFPKETCPWGKKAVKLLNLQDVDFQVHIFKTLRH